MIDVIDMMQWLGLSTLAVVLYVLTFHKNNKLNKVGTYAAPGWNFAVKKMWASRILQNRSKSEAQKFIDFHQFKQEFVNRDEMHTSHLIYGNDNEGNSLLINVFRSNDYQIEVSLRLQVANGTLYTLPATTKYYSHVSAHKSEKLEIDGLVLECLIPFQKWRITFNGLLLKRTTTEGDDYNAGDTLEFVKFNFFWSYAGSPQHWPADWSSQLKANALAVEPWRHSYWMEYLAVSDYGGLDQFGSLYGQIRFDEQAAVALNLPGVRQRRWTTNDQEQIRRSCLIVGVLPDGSVYLCGAYSLVRNLSNAQFGYIRTPNGNVQSIDWTDLHLKDFGEHPINCPKAMHIQFSAQGLTFSSTIYLKSTANNIQLGLNKATICSADIGLNGTHGQGVVLRNYTDKWRYSASAQNQTTSSAKTVPLKYSQQRPSSSKIAFWFHEAGARSLHISGGKGASLALLTSALDPSVDTSKLQFQVPYGFVLSVSAFELQFNANSSIIEKIRRIEAIACERVASTETLEMACLDAMDAIVKCPLVPEVEQTVRKFYMDMQLKLTAGSTMRVAVRSSAIGEDSDDASSAGQNETVLGLRSLEEVLHAVRQCWSSLFSLRSVEYRRQHVQPIYTQMAVVIQHMVASESAGVLFTRHPSTGNPQQILITANYGLGESVVSGLVDPDSFVLARSKHATQFEIVERHIGSKSHAIYMSPSTDSTIVQSDLSHMALEHKSCLTDAQILQLAQIGVILEGLYGNARDIEWAVVGDDVYVLQSRPITSLNSMSNWELLHEMDMAVMSKDDLHTFANVGEVFPECTTPLTYSTVVALLNRCTSKAIANGLRSPYNGHFDSAFGFSNYRLIINVYNVFLFFREKQVSLGDKLQGIAVCGHDYLTPEIHRLSIYRNGLSGLSMKLKLFKDMIVDCWTNEAVVRKFQQFVETIRNNNGETTLEELTTKDAILSKISNQLDDENCMLFAMTTHMHSSRVSTFSQILALSILAEGNIDLSDEHYADIGLMLRSCKDVESAEVPLMLEGISNAIYLAGQTEVFLRLQPTEGVEWLNANCASAAILFRNFISRHGHRAFKEFELMSETWRMRPDIIIEMIQATCRHSNDVLSNKPKSATLSNAQVIGKLKTPKNAVTRFILGYIMPLCQKSVQRREITKSCFITYLNELRQAYRQLADILFRDALLPDRQLIFFLTRDELADIVSAAPTAVDQQHRCGLINKAQRRMRHFPSWMTYRFDEFNCGVLQQVQPDEQMIIDWTSNQLVTGTSVNDGCVTGKACVITSFSEVCKIERGDILVTISTDIGWSTYFPILGGVVTELGGLISHGAVVAREYGLPCIVGATGATRMIRHGDRVTLNANKGTLYRCIE